MLSKKVLLAGILPIGCLLALPTLDHVAHGTAKIEQTGSELQIRASDKTILNYHDFNIEQHETVRFHMRDTSHRVLNRIHSEIPSQIDGSLLSNGIVYLINPAGIMFGPSSVVDVAGLYAAAAHLSDADFLQGIDRFDDVKEKIEFRGTLSAREVVLIGQSIVQKGEIKADHILYATAENIYLGREEGHLFVKSARESVREEASFLERGEPEALFLHHAGRSKANTIHLYGEKGSIVCVEGALDAGSGEITLQGEVLKLEGARIDVSGPSGGGHIFVGGGRHGKGIYPTSQITVCDEKTELIADATQEGNGGQIIIWADMATLFEASASARGGPLGGDGGFIETSSGNHFQSIAGKIDASAEKGALGHWELDPHSITIGSGPTTPGLTNSNIAPGLSDGTNNNYLVTPAFLQGIAANSTITMAATTHSVGNDTFIALGDSQGTSPANVNITNANVAVICNTVSGSGNGVFYANGSFITTGQLTIHAPVILRGPTTFGSTGAGVNFDFTIDSDPSTPNQDLTVTALGAILFGGLTPGSGTIGGQHPVGTLSVTSGNVINLNSDIFASGDITLNGAVTVLADCSISSSGGAINFPSTGAVQSSTPTALWNLTLSAAGDVNFHGPVGANPFGTILVHNAPNVNFVFSNVVGTANLTLKGPLVADGNITVTADTNIIGNSSIISNNGSLSLQRVLAVPPTLFPTIILSAPGTIVFGANVGDGPFSDFEITQASSVTFDTQARLAGAIHSTGDVTFDGLLLLSGNLGIFSSTGTIAFNGPVQANTAAVTPNLTLGTAGDISFHGNVGTPNLGAVTIENANNFTFFNQTNPALANYRMQIGSFTQLAGTGNTEFMGPLMTEGVPVQLIQPPTPPADGGAVSITTQGDINFYYLVQQGGGPTLTPVLTPAPGDINLFKSVITTTGGRQSSSVSFPNNLNAPNGLNGGSVTLNGNSINLLAIYAGGTPAFPGTSGIGGKGGDVTVTSTNGTVLRGPIFATGGSGINGGAQDLPTLITQGQNLAVQGADSPGNITINGPLTLGFNGVVLRGDNISIESSIQGEESDLLAIDASTAGQVQLGGMSNLSYFVVDYAQQLVVTGSTEAQGIDLFNAGSGQITFEGPATATDIQAIANRFCVFFNQGFSAASATFLNCGCSPSPSGRKVEPKGRGFAGVWFPFIDVFYHPWEVFSNDDSYLVVPEE